MKNIKVNKNEPAPKRITQPNSYWKEFFKTLEVGDWFEIPTKKQMGVRAGAVTHGLARRYTCYKHPIKKDIHVFLVTK